MYMIMYLNMYLYLNMNMYMNMYMYLNMYMITVVIIKSMRSAHKRANAPPFLGKISNGIFSKKNNFALDISASCDYIITIPTGYLISSYRDNELLLFGLLSSRLFWYERLLR